MAKAKRSTSDTGSDPGLARLLAKRDATYDQWDENAEEFARVQAERDAADEARAAKSTEKGA